MKKFSTVVEINVLDGDDPSIQDIQDLMQYLIEYGSLNIRDAASHIPIKEASFKIKDTKDISWMTEKPGLKVWIRKIIW